MKKLIIINGTMGVGKTTICKELYQKLNHSVWLDGDWCWMMHPFQVTEENINMVEDNISYLLKGFLNHSQFQYVILNWVIHREDILKDLLDRLTDYKFELYKISLICSEEALSKRMVKDGREKQQIQSSIERLKLYQAMDTIKIDTTSQLTQETIQEIIGIID